MLVLRALGLGDALTGVPALRGLRRLHPDRPLLLAAPDVIGRWFTDLGLVDGHVTTDSLDADPPGRALGRHDAVDLHGKGRLSRDLLHRGGPDSVLGFALPQLAEPLDGSLDAPQDGPPWYADEHEVERWCRLVRWTGGTCDVEDLRLPEALIGTGCPSSNRFGTGTPRANSTFAPRQPPIAVLHPGAAFASRRWPAERWASVARAVADGGMDVRLTGSSNEQQLCADVVRRAGLSPDASTAGDLDLPALAALVGAAGLLVCGDTGAAHLATALSTPSVLLFGPVAPALWGPAIDHDRHAVLWHGTGDGDPHGSEPDPALLRITAEEVLDAVGHLRTGARVEAARGAR